MMDLGQRLRSECVGAFSGDARLTAGFGLTSKTQAALLLQLCAPDVNYSRRSVMYQFLPPAFKALVTAPALFHERFGSDTLYVFHHAVSGRRMKTRLQEFAHAERRFLEQIGEERFVSLLGRQPLDPKEFLGQLLGRYENPTGIRMNAWGHASILGEQETNQDVVTHLKGGAERVFELLEQFLPAYVLEQERRCKRLTVIYDFFQRPVEKVYGRSRK